jgi:hypothetical protein
MDYIDPQNLFRGGLLYIPVLKRDPSNDPNTSPRREDKKRKTTDSEEEVQV